jgi:hypothetical protein
MDEVPGKAHRPAVLVRIESSVLFAAWSVKAWFTYVWLRLRRPRFRLFGTVYPIYVAWYNKTWRNERQVELPPALELVRQSDPNHTLELGNVLSNYQGVEHVVVDKYENQLWTVRQDIVDYRPGLTFRLIISISTLEHIGWDEAERDSAKFTRSLHHLVELLAPGGLLWATVPLGYSPFADAFLANPENGFDVQFMMRGSGRPGDWREVASASPEAFPYLQEIPTATAVAFIRYRRPNEGPE